MQLLQDIFVVENLQILSEANSKDTMKIRGVFGRSNEKNNNGRIYPTAVLEGQLGKVQPLINERRLCGELDHPQNDTVKLSNASHLITKLEMKGNELIGEAEILKTPAGMTAQALINGGVKIGISSRGMGTLSEDSEGNKIVNEDFRLVTFDLVADPSTRGAFPGLSESTESKFVKSTQSKLEKESNFVTLLEDKFRNAYKEFVEENRVQPTPSSKQRKEDTTPKEEVNESYTPSSERSEEEVAVIEGYKTLAYAIAEALNLVEAEVTTSRGRTHNVSDARAKKVKSAALKRSGGSTYTTHDRKAGTSTTTFGQTKGSKSVRKVSVTRQDDTEKERKDEATITSSRGKKYKDVSPKRAAQVQRAANRRSPGFVANKTDKKGNITQRFKTLPHKRDVSKVRIKTTPGEMEQGWKKLKEAWTPVARSIAEALGLLEACTPEKGPMKGSRQQGKVESRKASHNVQAERAQSKDRKERDKAKKRR
jgi:hypothetical protein